MFPAFTAKVQTLPFPLGPFCMLARRALSTVKKGRGAALLAVVSCTAACPHLGFVSAPTGCQPRPAFILPGASAQRLAVAPLRRTQSSAQRRRLRGGGQPEMTSADAEMPPGYQTPVQAIVDLVDAKSSPTMMVQPSAAGAEWVLMLQPSPMLHLDDLAQEELKLAGTRLLAHFDVESRKTGYESVSLLRRETREEFAVEGLPAGRIFGAKWAPGGQRIGLTVLTADGLFLYTFTPGERLATRAYSGRLSSAFASSFTWAGGGNSVLVNAVPAARGPLPVRPKVPAAPLVQACEAGRKAPARTYQDLLVDAHDEALFRYFATTQIVHVDVGGARGGAAAAARSIGEPGMNVHFRASPNAEWLLLETLREPLSRVVLWNRFAKDVTVVPLSSLSSPGGQAEHVDTCSSRARYQAQLALADSMPIGRDACRLGPHYVTLYHTMLYDMMILYHIVSYRCLSDVTPAGSVRIMSHCIILCYMI